MAGCLPRSGNRPRLLEIALILGLPVPYAAVLWMRRHQLERLPFPASWTGFLAIASGESQEHGRQIEQSERPSRSQTKPR